MSRIDRIKDENIRFGESNSESGVILFIWFDLNFITKYNLFWNHFILLRLMRPIRFVFSKMVDKHKFKIK